MQVTVLFFGPAKDITGTDQISLDLSNDATIGALKNKLVQSYPKMDRLMGSVRFAINATFASDDTTLSAGDEVAIIPPVSGGMDDDLLIALTHETIDAAKVRQFVSGDPASGAICTFEGVTRKDPHPQHGAIEFLSYEAYDSMAVQQMRRIATEAKQTWGASRVAILHRLGDVPPGEVSVMMAVACAHRSEAFEACRFLIDTLKKDVPIWKKDVYTDGYTHWVDPKNKT